MAYINAGGLPLFRKFARHLNNYSVMQVAERLFLHQPGWEGTVRRLLSSVVLGMGRDLHA
jgi:hypothetical protein